MSKQKDYYKVLNVNKNASEDDIKKSYKKLAREHHPDRGGNAEKFKEISEAYDILSDTQKRQQYDTFGTADGHGFDASSFFGGAHGNGQHFSSDFFSDIFGGFFGGNQGFDSAPIKGRNIQVTDTITLEELFEGKLLNIQFDSYIHCKDCKAQGITSNSSCSHCKGRGYTTSGFNLFEFKTPCEYCKQTGRNMKNVCKPCNGEGRVRSRINHKLKIPRGYDINKSLVYDGLGEAGVRSNGNRDADGDLILKLHLQKHNIFTKEGNDISMEYSISLNDAICGCTIELQSIDQKQYTLQVPSINMNKSMRITGAGFWINSTSSQRGDLIVNIKIKIPILTSTQKQEWSLFWDKIKNN